MKFRYFIKLWTDSALEARAPLCNCLLRVLPETSTGRRQSLGLPWGGLYHGKGSPHLEWVKCHGHVVKFICSYQFQQALLLYCCGISSLCVAPSFFHCRYKKWLLPHERDKDISHVDPMLRVWLWCFWTYSRGTVLNRRMQVKIISLRLWILWDAPHLIW